MVERNVNSINIRIPQAQFIAMYNGYAANKSTKVVHLNQTTKAGDYVTKDYFLKNLMIRWSAYRAAHKVRPGAIWTVAAPVVPVGLPKPAILLALEKALGGRINDFNDFYALIQQHGVYNHYNCRRYLSPAYLNKYGMSTAIQRIRNGGMNCADYSQLGIYVLTALATMGKKHKWYVKHVYCNSRSGKPNPKAGHFLLCVDDEDADVAEAASGAKPRPHNMCYYGYNKSGIIGNKLC